jgi:hypothetical protein
MNADISQRRRAIYTGLKPFMDDDSLIDAVMHWEEHFASAPRFTLQKFVSELCREGDLRSRRADILLSLVQAMNMPSQSLLPDPVQSSPAAKTDRSGDAFVALARALFDALDNDQRYQLRLDMLASLDGMNLPAHVLHAMNRWLNDNQPLENLHASVTVLRALVNRFYVLLCERLGPVNADKVLSRAVSRAQASDPAVAPNLPSLL